MKMFNLHVKKNEDRSKFIFLNAQLKAWQPEHSGDHDLTNIQLPCNSLIKKQITPSN